MLGWSYSVHRGGKVVHEDNAYCIEGGTLIMSIAATGDSAVADPDKLLNASAIDKICQGGYPDIWEVPASELTPLLRAADKRRPSPWDTERDAEARFRALNLNPDELLLVEVWDQS